MDTEGKRVLVRVNESVRMCKKGGACVHVGAYVARRWKDREAGEVTRYRSM